MNLVRLLVGNARLTLIGTGLAALVSGICNAGLIALVNTTLHRSQDLAAPLALGFACLGLGKLGTNIVSQILLVRYAQEAVASLRRDLSRKILSVPLRSLEEVGTPRLMVALTEDVLHIAQALLCVPGFGVNLAILAGGAAYLGWLSWKVLVGMCIFISLGAVAYRYLILTGFEYLYLARDAEDQLFKHFRALTEGIKELKLHRNRRSAFFLQKIQTATEAHRKNNITAEARFIIAHSWGHLLFFALIGITLFLLRNLEHLKPEVLTGYVITALYLTGPLAGLMASLSVFGRAKVALKKIEDLGASMSAQAKDACSISGPESDVFFEHLELKGVTHSYHHEKDDSNFVLGPIDLNFQRGELVFLVGGNGSGKSTLAKIITGLYLPESGVIRVNGKPVTNQNRDDYRQLFSALFSDFFLFDSFLGLEKPNLDDRAREYLVQLHLNHKVKVKDGTLSTLALSQGQRKRLALVTAYLEDRPFYLFDEWASDQDPQFKEIFYTQLLPDLKSRGRTVLVITHDENYFHVADRILKLDYGQLVHSDQGPTEIMAAVLPPSNKRSVETLTSHQPSTIQMR